MTTSEELWIPLVDEPIGSIVSRIEAEDAEVARLVSTPRRLLAFRTFSYIRVGLLLGELLLEQDVSTAESDGDTWVDALMRNPRLAERVRAEVREVARETAADPAYADDGPDDAARDRFREFAKKHLSG